MEIQNSPPTAINLALAAVDHGLIGIAKPGGGLDHRIQHRLQIEGRAADDLQHVAGRGLVFQRFLKIGRAGLQRAIRLGAADRDHRLLGEGLQQFDLAVGEAAGGRRSNGDRAHAHCPSRISGIAIVDLRRSMRIRHS